MNIKEKFVQLFCLAMSLALLNFYTYKNFSPSSSYSNICCSTIEILADYLLLETFNIDISNSKGCPIPVEDLGIEMNFELFLFKSLVINFQPNNNFTNSIVLNSKYKDDLVLLYHPEIHSPPPQSNLI